MNYHLKQVREALATRKDRVKVHDTLAAIAHNSPSAAIEACGLVVRNARWPYAESWCGLEISCYGYAMQRES